MPGRDLRDEDYQALLTLRTGLRRFLHWSAERAHEAGLTPAQHQLLLAVRGHREEEGPTIGDVAGYLLLRHHSVVELVRRAEHGGLIERHDDPSDRRVVRLGLTRKGDSALQELTELHIEELTRLLDVIRPPWQDLVEADRKKTLPREGTPPR